MRDKLEKKFIDSPLSIWKIAEIFLWDEYIVDHIQENMPNYPDDICEDFIEAMEYAEQNSPLNLLNKSFEEEKAEIVSYIKDRPAILWDIVEREKMEVPDFSEEDISDEYMIDWIHSIEATDDYESSLYDSWYLKWYEDAIKKLKEIL